MIRADDGPTATSLSQETVPLRAPAWAVLRPVGTGALAFALCSLLGGLVSWLRQDLTAPGEALGVGVGLLVGTAMLANGVVRGLAWALTVGRRTVVDTGTHLVGRYGRLTRQAIP